MRLVLILGFCLGVTLPLYGAPDDKENQASQIVEQGDKVMINLNDADVSVIVEYLARFSGAHYLIDKTVKGTISIMANKPVTRKEAVIILEEALVFNNFTILQYGLAKYVIPTRFAKQYGIDMKIGNEGAKTIDSGNIEMRFFKLDFISVRKMNTILNTIMSKNGQIIPHVQEKMLQVIDQTFTIKRMAELIEKMDVPDELLELYIIHLENTKAEKMVAQLKNIFAKNLTLVDSPNELEAEEDKINFFADERTNKIMVICHQKFIEQIRSTTRVLDQELGIIQQVQLYQVKNADPEDLAKQLTDLFPADSVKIKSDERLQALLVISQSDRMIFEVIQMATRLDLEAPKGAGDVRVYYLEHSDAKEMAETLNKLFEKQKSKNPKEELSIVPVEATNSLVVTGTRTMWEEVLAILEKLDIFRAQVMVEAVIVEVNMNFNKSIGLNLSQLGGDIGGGKSAFGLISDPLLSLGGGLNVGVVPDNESLANILNPESKVTPLALLRMFKDSSQANLLSAPQILTMDNEEATINVGELVPIQTSNSTSISQVSNIRFEDVGLALTLKPRITQKKTISLDVKLEVKSRSSDQIKGIEVPIIGRRALDTVVNTQHGGTVVIGGLMKENKTTTQSSVPIVSRIPYLGKLFQKKSRDNKKTNLFVFLTPYILTDDDELKEMTSTINERMNDSMKTSEFNPLSYSEGRGVTGGLPEKKTEVRPQIKVERIAVDGIAEDVKPASIPTRSSKLPVETSGSASAENLKDQGVPDLFEKTLDRIKKRKSRRGEMEVDGEAQDLADDQKLSVPEKSDSRTHNSSAPKSGRTPQNFLNSLRKQAKAAPRGPSKLISEERIAGYSLTEGDLKGFNGDQTLVKKFDDLMMKLRDQIQNGSPGSESSDDFDLLVSQIKEKLELSGI